MSGISKRVSGSWVSSDYGIMKTATDTITTLPAVLYPNDTTATVGLKGNTTQSGTPTPENPVMPQGTGERTENLYQFPYTLNLSLSGSGNNRTVVSTAYIRSNIIKLKPNTTYYFSGQRSQAADNFGRIALFADKPEVDSVSSHFYSFSNNGSVTFTTDATENYALVYLTQPGDYETNYNMMLIEGSTALPYEPYGYKIPISSAGQTTPVYLGEVQTTRKIKKYEFTGNEVFYASSQPSVYYTTAISNFCNKSATFNTGCIINAYKIRKQSTAANLLDGEFTADSNGYVWFRNYDYATIADFKSYLAAQYAAGTPVTVWYILAEPETAIVNEPLMKIGYADEVSGVSIPVTAGGDTLSVGTTVQPSEVTVNYKGWHPVQSVHEYDYLLASNPLCGISRRKDELNLATGACTRNINKLVFDGTEAWYASSNTGVYYTTKSASLNPIYILGICDRFVYHFVNMVSQLAHGEYLIDMTNKYTWFRNNDITSLQDWKNWLTQQYAAGTPVTVWYVLDEPTTETIAVPSGLSGIEEGYLIQDGTPTPSNPIYPTANGVKVWT